MPRSTQAERWTVNSVGRMGGKEVDVTIAVLSREHATYEPGVGLVEQIARLAQSAIAW